MHRVVATFTAAAVAMMISLPNSAHAKDKHKGMLPVYVTGAKTVAVVIDPEAIDTPENPQANSVAAGDVQAALEDWGRFNVVQSTSSADLIIVIRKGSGRLANKTYPGQRQDNRQDVTDPTDSGGVLGAQHRNQSNQPTGPGYSGRSASDSTADSGTNHPDSEIAGGNDYLAVYQGRVDRPLEQRPAWRSINKDGLRPHDVPAVEDFKKALAAADKAAAAAATKKP